MSNSIRIGLVLSSSPAYSETFFITKINGLLDAGFQVFLLAGGKTNRNLNCKQIRPYPVFENSFLRVGSVLCVVPILFLLNPGRVFRFWKFEKEAGLGTVTILKSIYLNAHILSKKLDWLHFGFATIAVGRENVARAIGAKMAVSFRGYDINVYPLKHPDCYKNLWQRVDQVHSISDYLLERAYALGLSISKRAVIITPAISTPVIFKEDFDLHNPLRLLTVARLTWIKGLEYGISAVARLKQAGLKVQYTLVGDGPEYEKLIAETDAFGLENEVIFTGKLSHEDTLKCMRSTDFYIQPSLNEGFCNAVLEAQAMGCLCIVSNVGALKENVKDCKTGWLVTPRDPDSLASVIINVINKSVEEKLQVSRASSQRVASDFSIQAHISAWIRFYK
jgi:colanic acid/amylovoran biosynthesis glycosyltransferase